MMVEQNPIYKDHVEILRKQLQYINNIYDKRIIDEIINVIRGIK